MDSTSKPSNPKDLIGSNKLPLHLWPEAATALGCLGFLNGALKYGRANFRAVGVRASIYVDAAKRHLSAWFEGEECDPDDGVPHLAAALACIAIIVDADAAGKLTDDRNIDGGYREFIDKLTPHVARLKELHEGKDPKHYTIADNKPIADNKLVDGEPPVWCGELRASADGSHKQVVDVFRPGRQARVLCLDCNQSWAEGARVLPPCGTPNEPTEIYFGGILDDDAKLNSLPGVGIRRLPRDQFSTITGTHDENVKAVAESLIEYRERRHVEEGGPHKGWCMCDDASCGTCRRRYGR